MLWVGEARPLKFTCVQLRRQTIKSGSAFKGQLYFQVRQMEGSAGDGVWGGARRGDVV